MNIIREYCKKVEIGEKCPRVGGPAEKGKTVKTFAPRSRIADSPGRLSTPGVKVPYEVLGLI